MSHDAKPPESDEELKAFLDFCKDTEGENLFSPARYKPAKGSHYSQDQIDFIKTVMADWENGAAGIMVSAESHQKYRYVLLGQSTQDAIGILSSIIHRLAVGADEPDTDDDD